MIRRMCNWNGFLVIDIDGSVSGRFVNGGHITRFSEWS